MSPNRRGRRPAGVPGWKRLFIIGLTMLVGLGGPAAHAAWTPQTDEWPTLRGGTTHTGASPLLSAFTVGQGGAARVKWTKSVPYPDYIYPPTVADVNRDGVPEIVVTSSDVKVQFGPPPSLSFNHAVHVLSGVNGDVKWSADEPNSFTALNGANVADVDGDANAEVIYFAGNPLTGTSSTNGLIARAGESGAQEWKFSDTLNWRADQQAISILTAAHGANVDADAANEAVFVMSNANLVITTSQPANCDQPRVEVQASNIHSFVHALNGTASAASNSWFRHFNPGLIASTPMITDLNGDGKNDVVFGAGTPAGELISGCEVAVTLDQSAFDNRIIAINGANPPNSLWEFSLQDPAGTPRGPAAIPTLAGTTAGGDPIVAMQVPIPETSPDAGDDYNVLLALNGRTGAELWRQKLDSASIAPLAAADLDNDGQPELVVQRSSRLATFRNRTGADFWSQGTGIGRGIAYARGLDSAGVAIGDLDSDGTQEIATILSGDRRADRPKAELLVVSGTDGAVEWTTPIVQDDAIGGPVIADVDGDDNIAEIVIGSGSLTVTDGTTHTGLVTVFEPNAPDLTVTAVTHSGNRLVGSPQTIQAAVKNLGTRDIAGATFRLLDNGAPVVDQTANLAAGASGTVSFSWTPASSGNHALTVVADPASTVPELVETNNQGSTTVKALLPPTAPVITSPAEGALLNNASVTVTGTADAGAIVSLSDSGVAFGTTTASSTGQWSHTKTYSEGAHALTAKGTDEAGNVSPSSAARNFTVDLTAPAAPTITSPPEGAIFESSAVTVSGQAEPLATVRLYEGAIEIGVTAADAAGAWSHTRPYSEGVHSVQATATDAAGNVSPRSAIRVFTVDTGAAPPMIFSPAEGAFLNVTSVMIVGSAEPSAIVHIDEGGSPIGTVLAAPDGTWSTSGTFLEGVHTISATQTDVLGHISEPLLRTFTIDLTAPAAPTITAPLDGSTVSTSSVLVEGQAEPFASVKVFEGAIVVGNAVANSAGSWSTDIGFANGLHTLVARAIDRAGNESGLSAPVTFNVAALLVTITDPAQNSFQPGSVTVKGTAEAGASLVLIFDGGVQVATTAVTDRKWSKTITLASGLHTLTARGTNGEVDGPVSNARTFTVDAAAPRLTIIKPSGYLLFQFMLLSPDVRALAEEVHAFDSGIAGFELTYEPILADGETMVRTGSCTGCGSRDAAVTDTPPLGLGLWEVTVKVTDKVGNVSTDTATLLSLGF
jgi:CARDB protein/Big-like domain-containing protein/VCBS repeat protein